MHTFETFMQKYKNSYLVVVIQELKRGNILVISIMKLMRTMLGCLEN